MNIVAFSIILLIGIAVYIVKPRYFFLYWLSIYPFILPVLYLLFNESDLGVFSSIIYGYPGVILNLMFLLFILSYNKKKDNLKFLIVPITLVALFILIQNIYVGLNISHYFSRIKDTLWIITPFILLISNEKIRPWRDSFIKYIIFFVYVQSFFCILNLFGIRIYGELHSFSGFDNYLICGTFPRYNHMANYLSIFFYILSYEYMENNRLRQKTFYFMALLIGVLIIWSGSRMALILYILTILFYICIYQSKIVTISIACLFASLLGGYIIGNKNFIGVNADEGTGLQRNMIGIVNLANTDDLSTGSTLSMSAYLLFNKFDSPLLGNGREFRGDAFYEDDNINPNFLEGYFRADSRLAFVLVDNGIIGLFLFIFLFVSILKGCYLYSSENKKFFYTGLLLYFLLFSITDSGFWDKVVFSSIQIYAFSIKHYTFSIKNRIYNRLVE